MSADKKVSLAMTAVAPTPIRLTKLEEILNSKPISADILATVAEEVGKIIKPISDVRSSAQYRLHVSGVLVRRALEQLLELGGRENV